MKTKTLFLIAICAMMVTACGTPSASTETIESADSAATLVLDSASALVDSATVDTTTSK